MATHSSTLAWKIPWMEEPGRLQSMGSLRVGHDWATSLSLFTFVHWRRKWHPTPVFLPGESQGRGSLVGCRLWGHAESDTTEATQQQQYLFPGHFLISMFSEFRFLPHGQRIRKKPKPSIWSCVCSSHAIRVSHQFLLGLVMFTNSSKNMFQLSERKRQQR